MKFDRLALIERAKARIAAAEKDAAERTADEARKAAGAEARHVAQFGDEVTSSGLAAIGIRNIP